MPAMNRIADELGCTDNDGEDDEHDDCVHVAHAVYPIIVLRSLELFKARNRAQNGGPGKEKGQ